jgi:hypothetical protein
MTRTILLLVSSLVVIAAGSAGAHAQPASAEARQQCAAAMNADPAFAAEITKIADEKAAAQRDRERVAAHNDA